MRGVEFLGFGVETAGSAGLEPPELNASSTVRTARSVYAALRQHEALHRSAADEVRLNDFFHIFHLDEAVPNRLGIDDDCRPMLTLIEAPRLVDPDS